MFIFMKSIKKLTLRKETVANLDNREMEKLKGGEFFYFTISPCPQTNVDCLNTPPVGYTVGCRGGDGATQTCNCGAPIIGYSVGYQC